MPGELLRMDQTVLEGYLRPKSIGAGKDSATLAGPAGGFGDSELVWVKDDKHGFVWCKVIEGGKVVCEEDGQTRDMAVYEKANPGRNDKAEDMAEMTELNEATVLHNLRRRYQSNLIYTYSGLFLVAVNPYRELPIYSDAVMEWYRQGNAGRADRPPHIFAIADESYRAMLSTRASQSILITGESGAGKTENTKRVIQYLANISSSNGSIGSILEDRIIQANPILEAFGNAQTIRNNNSSRFGKFVKIEFGPGGQIVGGNVERYLLEKGRVTNCGEKERNFHIFYQFLLGAEPELKAKFGITGGLEDYAYVRKTRKCVDGINDKADYSNLQRALDVLGFSETEKEGLFRCISVILLLGNLSFVADAEGQASFACPESLGVLCKVLGVGQSEFSAALLNPVIKAGSEVVCQARDVAQVIQAVEALSRALYDRLFTHIVNRINQAIDRQFTSTGNPTTFIGVLDIAGFEIFEKNSFEQLCVNYTNEKLQQFFNHHMFVSEQEEYRREGVTWDFIDFGLDLQPTIDLIEKANPIGILACLDEDCVVPKATDKTYCEKLGALWKGKSTKFEMTRFGDSFTLQHYAGKVEYRTDGWLEKNKDPLNENVTKLLAQSSQPILAQLFQDFAGSDEDIYRATGRGGKRGQFRTLSQKYRESLTLLMQQLHSTKPHFVRCILPNEEKKAGLIEAGLVLDQLRCNGVLEGIRICRLGYPNRIPYGDFCRLYEILSPAPLGEDKKEAALTLLSALGRDKESYRIGHGKVFFKAGELGQLDELRDQRLSAILQHFQARCRGALARNAKTRLIRQNEAKEVLQRNFKHFLGLKRWAWWRLYTRVKPLLNVTRAENKIEELEGELERIQEEKEQQLGNLRGELEAERDKLMALETSRREFERELGLLKIQLDEASESKEVLTERLAEMERESQLLKDRLTHDLQAKTREFNLKLEASQAMESELRQQLEEQKGTVSTLKAQVEEAEFEKMKLLRSESSLRARIQEMEAVLDEVKLVKKELEGRLRVLEDAKRELEDRLADESLEEERRKEYQLGFDAQLRQLKARHQEELGALSDDFDAARKRLQREVLQLTADLEAERKQSSSHLATIRKYESGADSLSSKLEAEMRAQEGWKREKERLESRIKDLIKSHQESVEREDEQQMMISLANEQLRSLKAQLGQIEDERIFGERQRKQLEAKLEKTQESLSHASGVIERLEESLAEAEGKVKDLSATLAGEQDENAVLRERLRASEHLIKLHQHQKDEAGRMLEEAQEEKKKLEQQVKDLQIRLLEHDDPSSSVIRTSSAIHSTTISTICSQIESECREKEAIIRENRKLERSLQELSSRLSLQDHQRISLEESLSKQEIKHRRTQTRLDEIEQALGEAELGKRRAERELAEEKEESRRILRELERLKAKQNAALPQPTPAATGFVNIE